MKKSTLWLLIIAGVSALLFCLAVGIGVAYMIQKQFDEAEAEAARIEAELQQSLDSTSALDGQLKEDLDFLIAMEDSIKKKDALIASREMTPEEFKALSDLEVLEILSYGLIPTEYVDMEAELQKPLDERGITDTITAPKGHALAGDFEKMPPSKSTTVLFDDVRFNTTIALSLIAEKQAPFTCDARQNPEIKPLEAFAICSIQELDKLARLRLGKPLYAGIARFDPQTISMITDQLLAIPPDTKMFGGERTLAQVYQQLDDGIPDYLDTRAAIAKHGDARALKTYQDMLKKRGVIYAPDTPDMQAFYEDFARKLDLDQSPYMLGFWLRRMDDGSAKIIHDSLIKAQLRYAK
jgi:hypothetical protein